VGREAPAGRPRPDPVLAHYGERLFRGLDMIAGSTELAEVEAQKLEKQGLQPKTSSATLFEFWWTLFREYQAVERERMQDHDQAR